MASDTRVMQAKVNGMAAMRLDERGVDYGPMTMDGVALWLAEYCSRTKQ
jgi:hypothetical protein